MANIDELPNPGPGQGPEQYRAMSVRFLDLAERELAQGLRLQASEKIWGAMTHQLAAIAEQRGWKHGAHADHYLMVEYLSKEFDISDLPDYYHIANLQHTNFYHNHQRTVDIQRALTRMKTFVAMLEDMRQSPPRPYTISNAREKATVQRLTGDIYEQGTTATPFMNEKRLERLRRKWGTQPPDVSAEEDDEVEHRSTPEPPLPTPQ